MGIRFKCHHCQAPMNVKRDLAQKRGICPHCLGRFRIPASSQDQSSRLSPRGELEKPSLQSKAPQLKSPPTAPSTSPANQSNSQKQTPNPVVKSKTATLSDSGSGSITEPPTNEPSALEQLFFVRPPSGGEYGPAAKEVIETWIQQKRVTAETLVCMLGSSQWKKAREVFISHFLLEL